MQLVATSMKDDGLIVVLLHPGAVITERQAYLSGYKGMVELPYSVEHMIKTIDRLTIRDAGHFLLYDAVPPHAGKRTRIIYGGGFSRFHTAAR